MIYIKNDMRCGSWTILETSDVTRSLRKLPPEIQRKYKAWVEIVKRGGSRNLKNFIGFRDEKLKGDLRECRSSRLNIQYRVIYKEDTKVREIIVLRVTPHNYRRV